MCRLVNACAEERVMSMPLVSSFGDLVLSFASVFTQPSFRNFMTMLTGWVFCLGRHTVTGLHAPQGGPDLRRSLTFGIVAAGAVAEKDFSCFHRFFSRANWSLDSLGRVILKLALRFVPEGETVLFAVDDTLGRKTGRHIWGAGMPDGPYLKRIGPSGHHDPLRSTPSRPVFSFGHSWVVLSIIVPLPFVSHRRFAIPFLFRLYRKKLKQRRPGRPKGGSKSTGGATPGEYRTRPELAVEMLGIAAEWLNGRRFRVVGDSEYSGKSVSRDLPETADLIGRMPMNAALYGEPRAPTPGRLGRPRKRGERLPNPAELARSRKVRWTKTRVDIYGKSTKVWFKSVDALWYNSAGTRLLRIVVVRDPSGRRRDDCFFTTDLSMKPTEIIETIAKRWALEVTFRDAKQSLGFEEPQSWSRKAVERTAPMAFVLYSLTVLWYAEHGEALREKWFAERPWYRRKRGPSFADMVATLRQASWVEASFRDPGRRPGSGKTTPKRLLQRQTWLSAAG
jgi:hypothetical protein